MRLPPKQQADAKAATNWKLKAFNAMVCDPRLNGTDIRVAWRIIDRMNVKCQSHPGPKLISEEIGCTRQTVLRSTARLEGFGYFDIAKGGGKGKSHSYTLIRETVRDDGQEPTKEPFMEPIKGGPAASPPEDGGAPSKKKDGLHGHAATYIPRENDGFDAASTHVLVLDGLRTAGFGNKGTWGFVLENWPVDPWQHEDLTKDFGKRTAINGRIWFRWMELKGKGYNRRCKAPGRELSEQVRLFDAGGHKPPKLELRR